MLPLRSLFLALAFVLVPAILAKLSAQERPRTHYYGDYDRRPLDGSYRSDRDAPGLKDWSASQDYRAAPQAPSYALNYDGVPLLAPIWTGLYGGLHGGGGWGQFDTSLGDADLSGAVMGAHIGYLIRTGAFVAGLEADADFSQVHHATNFGGLAVLMADVDWIVSARARAGVVAGPALFYATAGVAMTGVSAQADVMGVHSSTSSTQTAFVAGGGVEIGLNENIALRLEALHYFMDEEKFRLPFNAGTAEVGGSLTTVRAGLTFFLN